MSEPSLGVFDNGGFQWAKGIHVVEVPLANRIVRLVLLTGSDRILLFDTGIASSIVHHLLPYLLQICLLPDQISYVLISHSDFDHQGGMNSARSAFSRATFFCHSLDAPLIQSTEQLIGQRYGEFRQEYGIDDSIETKAWIRTNCHSDFPIDVLLLGGEEIRLGQDWAVTVLHTPGHTKGHLSLWDPRTKTAIIGDAALWSCLPTMDGHPAFPPTYRYVKAYRSTILALQSLNAEAMLTSHYPLLQGDQVNRFLNDSMSFTRRMEEVLENTLRSAPRPLSTRDLIGRLSPLLGNWPDDASDVLVYPLIGHLELFEESGSVCRVKIGPLTEWRWAS